MMICRPYAVRAQAGLSNRAFTLTELTIVLGVIGTLLGGVWMANSLVTQATRAARAAEQTDQIIAGFKSVFSSRSVDLADWTDITAMAINNNIMPADMILPGITAYGTGPWTGSQVNVFAYKSMNAVVVTYSNLPQSACIRLASATATGNPGLIWALIDGKQPDGSTSYSTIGTAPWFPPYGTNTVYTSGKISTFCGLTAYGAGATFFGPTTIKGNVVSVMYSMGG